MDWTTEFPTIEGHYWVNTKYQENFTNEHYGKYIVYKEDTQIKIMKLPEYSVIQTGDSALMKDE